MTGQGPENISGYINDFRWIIAPQYNQETIFMLGILTWAFHVPEMGQFWIRKKIFHNRQSYDNGLGNPIYLQIRVVEGPTAESFRNFPKTG